MEPTSFDIFICAWIHHSPAITKAMLWTSAFANWKFVVPFALLIGSVLWLKRKRKLIFPFWATLACSEVTVEIIKFLVQRSRPVGASFQEHSFSFPSGHSSISVALYGFLALMLWKQTKSRFGKGTILVATLLIVLSIGYSRIYLGVHFPTDVLAGYLVGATWLWIITHHIKRFDFKFPKIK